MNSKAIPERTCEEEKDEGCRAITFAEQRRIMKEIENPKYLRFFYFCCCTGMRVCEALSVKTKNIDKRKRIIRIDLPDTKTKKHRRAVPYLPELLDGMNTSGKYLFEDITEDGSEQYFAKLYKQLELDLCRHSARHTFISVCHFIGIDDTVIQEWAGHTNLKMTTGTYTHELDKGSSPILDYLKKLKKQLAL